METRSRKRRLRPRVIELVGMIALNAVVSAVLLRVLFVMFGVSAIIPELSARFAWAAEASRWSIVGTLIPGAAVSYGLLWFWLVITGRTQRGISWGGAAIYGAFAGIYDVPIAGFLTGLQHGYPILGLLLGLVMVFLVPSVLLMMITFGITMGLNNGRMARRWIERHYPSPDR